MMRSMSLIPETDGSATIKTRSTPLSDAKLMEQLMPDAGLVTLKNCGHYSFLEQQFTFNKVLASFMEID